jgi:AcrR family transcriptional regulator
MARLRPDARLDDLVHHAAAVFIERGYRRTQMADVAKAMGVAPGTLYLYVQSKDALFDLVVLRAFVDAADHAPLPLPLPTPRPETTLRHVRERFARESQFPRLRAALRQPRPADARPELEGVVRELFATIARNRRGLKLLERSALDWPELTALYFTQMRRGVIDMLTRYLARRIEQRHFCPVPDVATAARLVLETVSWFAMHRHSDPDPMPADDAAVEDTVVAILGNAFAPAPGTKRATGRRQAARLR